LAEQRALELTSRRMRSAAHPSSTRSPQGPDARTMTRILFVDESPQILEALQRLRGYRQDWRLAFARGSRAALTELEHAPFDIVVSDLRMAAMDGVELLSRVKELHPGSVRMILSVPVDRSEAARVLPVAHQFLSKPCDIPILQSTLHRASELRRVFHDKAI